MINNEESRAVDPLLLSIPDAVRLSGFSRSEIYRRLAAGELEARKIGRSVRITMDSIKLAVANLPRATFRRKSSATSAHPSP